MAKQKAVSRKQATPQPAGGWPLSFFSDDFDRFFSHRFPSLFRERGDDGVLANWKPAVDVKETDKEYVVTADIPGVDPKDIEVTMENGVLTIKGKRESEERDESNGYRRVERFEGSFFRRMVLPDSVDSGDINAKSRNGVVEIHVPKSGKPAARRIPVK